MSAISMQYGHGSCEVYGILNLIKNNMSVVWGFVLREGKWILDHLLSFLYNPLSCSPFVHIVSTWDTFSEMREREYKEIKTYIHLNWNNVYK